MRILPRECLPVQNVSWDELKRRKTSHLIQFLVKQPGRGRVVVFPVIIAIAVFLTFMIK